MLPTPSKSPARRVLLAGFLYLLTYSVAAYADLWTTAIALSRAGANEGNAFVTSQQRYMSGRAWAINLAGALIMTACAMFAAKHAQRVEILWLRNPIASFRKIYLSPWSDRAIGVSPLHLLSMALAFLALRLLAAANNLLIYFCGLAPIGAPIERLAQHVSVFVAFGIVIIPLFYLVALVVSPLAARIILSWQRAEGSSSA
jgi:hypothetical protein